MTQWQPVFILWPTKIEGRWRFLSLEEVRYDDSDYIGGTYGGPYYPRAEYRLRLAAPPATLKGNA